MTARRLYARIIVGSLKGMAVGLGIGPFTGYLVMSLAYALADQPPDPNGSPGLTAAPFIFAFWGGIIGAILLGAVSGVRICLAADSPAATPASRDHAAGGNRHDTGDDRSRRGVLLGIVRPRASYRRRRSPTQPQRGGSRRMPSDVARGSGRSARSCCSRFHVCTSGCSPFAAGDRIYWRRKAVLDRRVKKSRGLDRRRSLRPRGRGARSSSPARRFAWCRSSASHGASVGMESRPRPARKARGRWDQSCVRFTLRGPPTPFFCLESSLV